MSLTGVSTSGSNRPCVCKSRGLAGSCSSRRPCPAGPLALGGLRGKAVITRVAATYAALGRTLDVTYERPDIPVGSFLLGSPRDEVQVQRVESSGLRRGHSLQPSLLCWSSPLTAPGGHSWGGVLAVSWGRLQTVPAPGRWGVSTGGNREQDPEDGRPRRGP